MPSNKTRKLDETKGNRRKAIRKPFLGTGSLFALPITLPSRILRTTCALHTQFGNSLIFQDVFIDFIGLLTLDGKEEIAKK